MKRKIALVMILIMILNMLMGCNNSKSSLSSTDGNAKSDFPSKPIEMIVPYAAGGASDVAARVLAKTVSKYLPNNQNVVVINKAGASGTLGTGEVVNRPADGYSVCFNIDITLSQAPYSVASVKYDWRDFDYLMGVTNLPVFIQVLPNSKYNTLELLMEAFKSENKAVTLGTIGVGSTGHLVIEMLKKDYGMSNYTCVPFKSTSEAWNALQQKTVDAILCGTDSEANFLRLATASDVRSKLYPDVPTMTEKGYPMNIGTTNVLVTKAGTPEDVKAILTDAFQKAMNDPETLETFRKIGVEHLYLDGESIRKKVEEQEKWGIELLDSMGLYINDPKK